MQSSLTGNDLKMLAQAKLEDGNLLFQAGRFSNAYYISGYALELGLKACVAKHIVSGAIPDKQMIIDTYTHSLDKLVGVAGLRIDLNELRKTEPEFGDYWAIVSQWSPDSRYQSIDRSVSQYFINAIIHPQLGVFKWIKSYW